MLHPENFQPLTDRFGDPIDEGDKVVIAYRPSKYSAKTREARLEEGVVVKLVPLGIHPMHAGQTWHSTGPNSRIPLVREDQLNRSHQTEYYSKELGPDGMPLWEHAYVANVKIEAEPRARCIVFGSNLIVYP